MSKHTIRRLNHLPIAYRFKDEDKVFDPAPRLQVGDRFLSRDPRDGERIVVIVEVLGLGDEGRRYIERALTTGYDYQYLQTREQRAEYWRQRNTRYLTRNEKTGRTVSTQENTLREKFKALGQMALFDAEPADKSASSAGS